MNRLDDLHELLDNFNYLKTKMRDEGFHYCFKHYSNFDEIKDIEFHKLRKKYIKISDELSNYIDSKIDLINDEIYNFEDDK